MKKNVIDDDSIARYILFDFSQRLPFLGVATTHHSTTDRVEPIPFYATELVVWDTHTLE